MKRWRTARLAAALFSLWRLKADGAHFAREWLTIALPFLALAIVSTALSFPIVHTWFIGEATLLLILGLFLPTSPRLVAAGALAFLAILALLMSGNRLLSTYTWNPVSVASLAQLTAGTAQLNGRYPGVSGYRRWAIDTGTKDVTLRLQMRRAVPVKRERWSFRQGSGRIIRTNDPSGRAIEELIPGPGGLAANLRLPLGTVSVGTGFRVMLRLSAGGKATCGEAAVIRGKPLIITNVCLGPGLSNVSLPFAVKNGVALASAVNLRLRGFDAPVAIRQIAVDRRRGGGWGRLYSSTNPNVTVQLHDAGPWTSENTVASARIKPTSAWRTYTLSGTWPKTKGSTGIYAVVRLDWGQSVQIRRVSLNAEGGRSPQSRADPSQYRQRLWFSQPNLAGHSAAAIGLAFLTLCTSFWWGVGSIALMLYVVALTGSRAALFAVMIGSVWLLLLDTDGRRRRRLVLIGLIVGAAAVPAVSVAVGGNSGIRGLGSLKVDASAIHVRGLIWHNAWTAFTSHPLTGSGGQKVLSRYLRERAGDTRAVASHAHNLWLQFAAAYGLPGLLASLWLSGGLLVLAWQRGRWRGIAFLAPLILVMQAVDYTLFYAYVLIPILLTLKALRRESKA